MKKLFLSLLVLSILLIPGVSGAQDKTATEGFFTRTFNAVKRVFTADTATEEGTFSPTETVTRTETTTSATTPAPTTPRAATGPTVATTPVKTASLSCNQVSEVYNKLTERVQAATDFKEKTMLQRYLFAARLNYLYCLRFGKIEVPQQQIDLLNRLSGSRK